MASLRPEGTRLTWREWDKLYSLAYGVYIIDPDGFPRHDLYKMVHDTYSEEDFLARLGKCTVGFTPDFKGWPRIDEA